MEYNKKNKLRVFTAFSGYDSQCLALDRLKIAFPEFDYDLVGWSEIDEAAIAAHNANYPNAADKNYGDISKIDWSKVPDFDLFTYSFPCTDVSNAGAQMGLSEGSGTRSSLLWECRKAIIEKRPKYLLLENVSALVTDKFLPYFNKWRDELYGYGYENFAQLLNSKNFGVPQNRERIFLFSIYDPTHTVVFNWPEPFRLKVKLKDLLETGCSTKYYLNPNKVNKFVKENLDMIKQYAEKDNGEIEPLPDYLREWLDNYPEEEEEEKESPFKEQELDFDDKEETNNESTHSCGLM